MVTPNYKLLLKLTTSSLRVLYTRTVRLAHLLFPRCCSYFLAKRAWSIGAWSLDFLSVLFFYLQSPKLVWLFINAYTFQVVNSSSRWWPLLFIYRNYCRPWAVLLPAFELEISSTTDEINEVKLNEIERDSNEEKKKTTHSLSNAIIIIPL